MIIKRTYKLKLILRLAQCKKFFQFSGVPRVFFNRGCNQRQITVNGKPLVYFKQIKETSWSKKMHNQVLQLKDLKNALLKACGITFIGGNVETGISHP